MSTALSKMPTRVQILPGRTATMRRTRTTSQQLYLSRPAARDGDGHLPLPASPPLPPSPLFSTAPEAFVPVSLRVCAAAAISISFASISGGTERRGRLRCFAWVACFV